MNNSLVDKNGNQLAVGDLVIALATGSCTCSAGLIYRIKEINFGINSVGSFEASCVSMYDRFLNPKKRGNFITFGYDVIKIDQQFASDMSNKWSQILAEEFTDDS